MMMIMIVMMSVMTTDAAVRYDRVTSRVAIMTRDSHVHDRARVWASIKIGFRR